AVLSLSLHDALPISSVEPSGSVSATRIVSPGLGSPMTSIEISGGVPAAAVTENAPGALLLTAPSLKPNALGETDSPSVTVVPARSEEHTSELQSREK